MDPFGRTIDYLRLTADGKLRQYLGRHGELDRLGPLRRGEKIDDVLREGIANKPENHQFSDCYEPGRPINNGWASWGGGRATRRLRGIHDMLDDAQALQFRGSRTCDGKNRITACSR